MQLDRIAIAGGRGQLGYELSRQLGSRAWPLDRYTLEISNRDSVIAGLLQLQPSAIINAAAFTNVDLAESEPDRCHVVNGTAVSYLVDACHMLDCPLVQVSTDYVFGGENERQTPYQEHDVPSPINVYGHSKLQGEQYAARHDKHFIVRTCGLYGARPPGTPPHDFVETMLALSRKRPTLRVVNDQYCTPSYVGHVAQAILSLLGTSGYGTYHVVNEGSTTWYQFAVETFRLCGVATQVEPIPSSAWVAAARRPSYSVLDTSKYQALFGPLPKWQDALAEYLNEHHATSGSGEGRTQTS